MFDAMILTMNLASELNIQPNQQCKKGWDFQTEGEVSVSDSTNWSVSTRESKLKQIK